MGRRRVLYWGGTDTDSHFAGDGTIQMGWKEVAMRTRTTTQACDRCGLAIGFEVGTTDEQVATRLNNDGWRTLTFGSFTDGLSSPISVIRDICRLCYLDISAVLEIPQVAKPDHSTVQ